MEQYIIYTLPYLLLFPTPGVSDNILAQLPPEAKFYKFTNGYAHPLEQTAVLFTEIDGGVISRTVKDILNKAENIHNLCNKAHLSEKKWTYLSIEEVRRYKLCQKILASKTYDNTLTNAVHRLQRLNNTLHWELDIRPSNTTNQHTRDKRSLLPWLGTFHNWLEGVPDEKMWDNMNLTVSHLQRNQNQMIKTEKQTLAFVNNSLHSLLDDARKARMEMLSIQEQINKNLTDQIESHTIQILIDDYINNIKLQLIETQLITEEFLEFTQFLQMGKVYNQILDMDQIQQTLTQIQNSLEPDLAIPFTKHDLLKLLAVTEFAFQRTEQTIHIRLLFPITRHNETCQLFTLTPIPRRIRDNGLYEYTPPEFSHYLQNINTGTQYGLTEEQLRNWCKTPDLGGQNKTYICNIKQFYPTETNDTNYKTTQKFFKIREPLTILLNEQSQTYLIIPPHNLTITAYQDGQLHHMTINHPTEVTCTKDCLIKYGNFTIKSTQPQAQLTPFTIQYEPDNTTQNIETELIANLLTTPDTKALTLMKTTDPFQHFAKSLTEINSIKIANPTNNIPQDPWWSNLMPDSILGKASIILVILLTLYLICKTLRKTASANNIIINNQPPKTTTHPTTPAIRSKRETYTSNPHNNHTKQRIALPDGGTIDLTDSE